MQVEERIIPKPVMLLAEKLSKIHGAVRIAHEKHGLHLYMASPEALVKDGQKELRSKHLAVNADKHLCLGKYATQRGRYDNDRVGVCMKYRKPYTVSELLAMPPVDKRGLSMDIQLQKKVSRAPSKKNCYVTDINGNVIPDHPGLVESVVDLPAEHPVRLFLKERRYEDPSGLVRQFNAAYCYQEAPESYQGHFYRPLPGPDGMKDTPQGRLILYAYVNGVQVGWQARLLEIERNGIHMVWHPYTERWVVDRMRGKDGAWLVMKDFKDPDPNENPFHKQVSKYRTADGAFRNDMLMGYDAAVAWNEEHRKNRGSVGIVVEGPLDAARLGPPAMAKLGKYLAPEQAILLKKKFDTVILLEDNDRAGRESVLPSQRMLLTAKVKRVLSEKYEEKYGDPDDFPDEYAKKFKTELIDKAD